MYDFLRSLEAPAKSEIDEDRLATKLASLPLDTLIDLQSNTSLREALAYELVKEAAPFNIGQLGTQLTRYVRKNPGAAIGAGVGAVGGGIAGAQDGGGLSGALGGAAMGGAAGGAAGHFGGKALKGMGKTPPPGVTPKAKLPQGTAATAPVASAQPVARAPLQLPAAGGSSAPVARITQSGGNLPVTPTPQSSSPLQLPAAGNAKPSPNSKFTGPSGQAPVDASGRVQIPVASVRDANTVMPAGQSARQGLGSSGGSPPSSAPMTTAPVGVRGARAPISGPAGSSSLRRADGALISGPPGAPTSAPHLSNPVAALGAPAGAPPVPAGGDYGGQAFNSVLPPTYRSPVASIGRTGMQGPSTAAFV